MENIVDELRENWKGVELWIGDIVIEIAQSYNREKDGKYNYHKYINTLTKNANSLKYFKASMTEL